MTSTAVVALPSSGDATQWTEQERALVEAAGLVRTVNRSTNEQALADRPTVEAFLQHCRRTNLDPIARQIYAIYRGGKWGIQISIDGARLVAERTKQYEGQTPVEWTGDGVTWSQVWLSSEYPAAARVGVFRTGFREPLYAVARWDSYVVMKDVWRNGRKVEGEQTVSDMWAKMPDLMLGKVAEMLALRKAFPQDLSGLYSTEEMQQADRPAASPASQQSAPASSPAPAPEPPRTAATDWALKIADAGSVDELRGVYEAAEKAQELGLPFAPEHADHVAALVDLFALDAPPASVTVGQMIGAVKRAIESAEPSEPAEEVVEGEVVDEGPAGEPVTEWPTATPGGEA